MGNFVPYKVKPSWGMRISCIKKMDADATSGKPDSLFGNTVEERKDFI